MTPMKPREEAKDAVARAQAAGIRPMMITVDHPKTAAVIAEELGIVKNGRAVTGAELERMPEEMLDLTGRLIDRCEMNKRWYPNKKKGGIAPCAGY